MTFANANLILMRIQTNSTKRGRSLPDNKNKISCIHIFLPVKLINFKIKVN